MTDLAAFLVDFGARLASIQEGALRAVTEDDWRTVSSGLEVLAREVKEATPEFARQAARIQEITRRMDVAMRVRP